MKVTVMAAYDKKARAFLQPYYVSHPDVGVRAFSQAVNTPDHQVHKFASDFSLYELGTFDDDSGKFDLLPQPKFVAEAVQLLAPVAPSHPTNEERN